MLEFLLLLANLAYFGSPLLFGAVAGLVYGVFSSRISVRRCLLWGVGIGLVGVAVTTAIIQPYSYWNDNLRGWPNEQDRLDYRMISIRPLIVYSPLWLATLTVGATLLALRFKVR